MQRSAPGRRTRKRVRTKCDGIHFAFDNHGGVLDAEKVNDLTNFSVFDGQRILVLEVFLHKK